MCVCVCAQNVMSTSGTASLTGTLQDKKYRENHFVLNISECRPEHGVYFLHLPEPSDYLFLEHCDYLLKGQTLYELNRLL